MLGSHLCGVCFIEGCLTEASYKTFSGNEVHFIHKSFPLKQKKPMWTLKWSISTFWQKH